MLVSETADAETVWLTQFRPEDDYGETAKTKEYVKNHWRPVNRARRMYWNARLACPFGRAMELACAPAPWAWQVGHMK